MFESCAHSCTSGKNEEQTKDQKREKQKQIMHGTIAPMMPTLSVLADASLAVTEDLSVQAFGGLS